MIITTATDIGTRPYQEDRHCVYFHNNDIYLAVFDGHGGSKTVDTLRTEFPALIERYTAPNSIDRNPVELLKTIHAVLDERTEDFEDGSTASMGIITKDKVVLSVLGDSPIQAITTGPEPEVTLPDHNVRSNKIEHYEAIQRGGTVLGGYLFDSKNIFGRGLQMSRAFGNVQLRAVLNQTPEIFVFDRALIKSLLIASDGIVDSSHSTAPFVLTKHCTAQELVDSRKDIAFDNVTAIVVHF